MRFRRFLGALVLSSFALTAHAQTADLRGIYVWSAVGDTPFSTPAGQQVVSALNIGGVDGLLLIALWASLEPSMGQYDFKGMDQWLSYAAAHGKKVTLAIRAGDGTPSWLFQPPPNGAGAKGLDFTISPHDGKTNVCISETLAAPWDPIYVAQWDALLAAVAAHLKSSGTYNTVTALRLTGINRTSDELRLPAETAQSTGLSCVSDSIATWTQAGYTPANLLSAWSAITGSFAKSFPDKSFSVAIITNPPQVPFPAIGDNGAPITGTLPDQNAPLLQLASQRFPHRLVVQFNFLMEGQPANPFVIAAAHTYGTMAAYQTNNYYSLTGTGSAACGGTPASPTPCTADQYLALLETGIYPSGRSDPLRAQYIEVWSSNASAFPQDIATAHDELDPPEHRRAARH